MQSVLSSPKSDKLLWLNTIPCTTLCRTILGNIIIGEVNEVGKVKKIIDDIHTWKISSRNTVVKDITYKRVIFSLDFIFMPNMLCSLVWKNNSVITKNYKSVACVEETIFFFLNTTHCTRTFNRILKEIFGIQILFGYSDSYYKNYSV